MVLRAALEFLATSVENGTPCRSSDFRTRRPGRTGPAQSLNYATAPDNEIRNPRIHTSLNAEGSIRRESDYVFSNFTGGPNMAIVETISQRELRRLS